VHPFDAIGIPQSLDIGLGFEDEPTGVLDSLEDGMPPTVNGFPYPIGCRHLVHDSGVVDEFRIGFLGNKVGVGPVII